MTLSARRLGPDDAEAARQLGMEAFGVFQQPANELGNYRSTGDDLVWGL
jgi:hypothetical protein